MARRRNPAIFGVDVVDAIWMSLGAGLTAWLNDSIIAPLGKRLLPSLYQNQTIGKLVDAFTTFLAAYGVGVVVGAVSRPVGDLMHLGGGVLAGARLVTVVIPGFQLSAKTPLEAIHLPFANVAPAPPTQLPAAPQAPNPAQSVMQGVRNMGF